MPPQTDQFTVMRRLQDQNRELAAENASLKHGGGDGTSGGMDAVDARIAAAEARTDTKFAELRGDLKDFATKSTVWGAVATGTALMLAVLAFGGDRFDAGLSASDIIEDVEANQGQIDARQDDRLQSIDEKLDLLLERTTSTSAATPD